MSVYQSGLRRSVGKNDSDNVSRGVRSVDLIAAAFFIGLNFISLLGEVTKVFAKYGRFHPGITFLYQTFCYPMAVVVSHLFYLKGDNLYVWMMAQLVFILTSLLLWVIIIMLTLIWKLLRV